MLLAALPRNGDARESWASCLWASLEWATWLSRPDHGEWHFRPGRVDEGITMASNKELSMFINQNVKTLLANISSKAKREWPQYLEETCKSASRSRHPPLACILRLEFALFGCESYECQIYQSVSLWKTECIIYFIRFILDNQWIWANILNWE